MSVLLRSFLWSLAVVLSVGLMVSWLDVPTALAQDGDELELEVGEGVNIQDNPYLYWKCWRTDSKLGWGFTAKDFKLPLAKGLSFATPYLPQLTDGRVDSRGFKLTDVKAERWKRTRADLIDARFYRSTSLLGRASAADPSGLTPLADAEQEHLFKADPDRLLPQWNPFLSEGDARIKDIDVQWSTGAGKTGESHQDDVDRLQQEQGSSATVAEQGVSRAVAYRGDSEPVAGHLSEYANLNEDPSLGGQNALGARIIYGTETAQVVDLSGTVTTSGSGSGSGGGVTTTVDLESTSRDVTNNVSTTHRVDPTNPEVFTTTVSKSEDHPRLYVVASSGWRDDGAGSHSLATVRKIALRPQGDTPMPDGAQLAKKVDPASSLHDWAESCFVMGVDRVPGWPANFPYREYRFLCWLVRDSSVESPLEPQPVQTLEAPVVRIGAVHSIGQTILNSVFGNGTTIARPPSGGVIQVDDVPIWIESDLTETSDALYFESASRRRGTLAPPEIGDEPNDEIVVSVNLKDGNRRDPTTPYDFLDDSGATSRTWKLFGNEMVGRRTIVHGEDILHGGYKQSYMLPPFWGGQGEADRVVPWMYDHDEELMGVYGMESFVLWPVYLADMNYYLFKVDGFTKEHAGDRGHILNLAYAGVSGIEPSTASVMFMPAVTMAVNIYNNYRGKTGVAVGVPAEVKGTSGRTAIGLNNQHSLTSMHINPFTPGKLYYPFYDVDQYSASTYWDNYNLDSPTRFDTSDLLKAGVVSPDDAGGSDNQYGANSRFQWVIREGEAVAGLEEGNVESVYRRLGIDPGYLSNLDIDEDERHRMNPFEIREDGASAASAWPNSYISPDETHVLLLTFYEGRDGRMWKFVPKFAADAPLGTAAYDATGKIASAFAADGAEVLGGLLNMVGAAQVGENLNTFAKELSGAGALGSHGGVPTFQYRRVLCRVVVPPDGVVTPGTGLTAVVDSLEVAKDFIVEGIKNAIGGLIGWLESFPGKFMTGMMATASEGACHGGGILSDVGDGENDVGSGTDPTTGRADLVIDETEHTDRLSKEKCEKVVDDGIDTGFSGACDQVGAAVQDPACSSVPVVNFLEYGLTGLSFEIDWNSNPYREVWYYGYPGSDEKDLSTDAAYRQRFSLKEATDFEKGAPDLLFRLPYAHIRSLGGLEARKLNQDLDSQSFGRDLDIREAIDVIGSADFDGYVVYVKPDDRAFRYVDCKMWVDSGTAVGEDRACDSPPGVPTQDDVAVSPKPLQKEEEYRFVLPRYYVRYAGTDTSKVEIGAVKEFRFGSVPLQADVSNCLDQSVKMLAGEAEFGCKTGGGLNPLDVSEKFYEIGSGGAEKVQFIGKSEWERFGFMLDYVWYLGAGMEYTLSIAGYRGVPDGAGDWEEGPISRQVKVTGGAGIACLDDTTYWVSVLKPLGYDGTGVDGANAYAFRSGSPTGLEDARERAKVFQCEASMGPGGQLSSYGPGSRYYRFQRHQWSEWRKYACDALAPITPLSECDFGGGGGLGPRLLSRDEDGRGVIAGQAVPDLTDVYHSGYLIGSTVCGGIWSGTPSGMTWDSPVVRSVWQIAWVVAMVLLFVLLLWDGLSLTYAGWINEGRGGVSISSMVPRFLLALLLASASLFICRIVLTLSADLVCFFISATGMTFWNTLVGVVFGPVIAMSQVLLPMMIGGLSLWAVGSVLTATGVLAPLGGAMATLGVIVMAGVVLIMLAVLLFVIYYAIKVFGTMIVRIVLLMVLIGLGPVAFAMYASPSTEHWTKKWVNLLLGTTFQQVMVLAVLFIGGAMASAATYELSLWREYWQVMFFALASLMVLFVAAKVPDLVNPGAQGLFSGFVQAATMALAAGAMIGGGLAGAGSVIAGRGGGMMSNLGSRIMNMRPGGGGMNAPGEAAQTAGGTMSGVARDAGGAGRVGSSGSSPVAESGNNAGNRDFGLGGGDTPTGGAPSGGSGSGGGGGGGGGGGFAREVGRGFMGGASRGTRLGRAMMDVQGGRFFLNDPTTAYAPNSQAQMQGLRDYAAGREFGSNPRDMEQAQQQRLNRGGGYGYRPRYDREQGPDHELPEEGLGGDQSGGDQSGGENG